MMPVFSVIIKYNVLIILSDYNANRKIHYQQVAWQTLWNVLPVFLVLNRSVTTCTQCMLVSILLLVLRTYQHRTSHSLQLWTGGRAPCCIRYTLDLSKTVMETA